MKIKTRKMSRKGMSAPQSQPAQPTRPKLTGRAIDAMTPVEKQRLIDKLESETPEQRRARSRPITPADQARLERIVGRGRPKLGKGTRVVSVSVEVDLLARADAYARKIGLKRAELFTRGLKSVVPA